MVPIRMFDYGGVAVYAPAHKCVNCGEILDATILENRYKVVSIHQKGRGRNRNSRGIFVKEVR